MPETDPPAAQQTTEETGAKRFAGWTETLERVGKHVVVATFAIVGVGYAIAVGYYAGVGVPASELSHNTYVGAGLLFVAMESLAAVAGLTILRGWRTIGPRRYWRKISFGILGAFGFSSALTLIHVTGGWSGMAVAHGYFLANILVVMWFDLVAKHRHEGLVPKQVVYASMIFALLTTFPRFVYSMAPAAFGGARPVELFAWNPAAPPSNLPATMASLACPESTQPPACRVVALVYSGSSHLYFAVDELATACPHPANEPGEPLFRPWYFKPSGARRCFVRVLDSDVKLLATPSP